MKVAEKIEEFRLCVFRERSRRGDKLTITERLTQMARRFLESTRQSSRGFEPLQHFNGLARHLCIATF